MAVREAVSPGQQAALRRSERAARLHDDFLQDLIGLVGDLRTRDVRFTSLHEQLGTAPGRAARLPRHRCPGLAEFIRELIVAGTHEGLAAACAHAESADAHPP